jgi:hypothetical protein
MKLALGPRGMKLSLIAVLAIGVSLTTGCAASVQGAAAPSAGSERVGTTTLTSAAMMPSTLAPAAWDADEASATPAPVAVPTWGTAVAVTSPAN